MNDQFPPVFATNEPEEGLTVADEINRLLATLRQEYASPPTAAIATAYLNPGGFSLLVGELEQVPHVRLMLGAEPDPSTSRPATLQVSEGRLRAALGDHEDWLAAERDLTGFTREEDASARRLVEWLQSTDAEGSPRVEVRRYTQGFLHGKAYIAEHDLLPAVLAGSSNFTYAGLAKNAELNLGYPSGQYTHLVQEWFDKLWDQSDTYPLADIYADRWRDHPPWLIFLRMLWELYGAHLDEDDDSKIRTLLDLTGYQREGVARMLRLLDENGGVLVADEVGLGKTFMAGEVIRRASEQQRQQVLIVTPAALKSAMWEPFLKKWDFSRRVDVLSYDELRLSWDADPEAARRELDSYALVVVDEAHNLRNPNAQRTEAVSALVGGANPKRLILLTATPVNNSLFDLHTLFSLYIRNDAAFADVGIPSIRSYIKRAEAMDPDSLSPEHLFDLMDRTTVRRTRRFIKKHYIGETVPLDDGTRATIRFPQPELNRLDYDLDEKGQELLDRIVYSLDSADDGDPAASRYEERQRDPHRLMLSRYTSSAYDLEDTPVEAYQVSNVGLLRSTLLKRLESSPIALRNTLGVLIKSHTAFVSALDEGWVLAGDALREWTGSNASDFEDFLAELDDMKSTQVESASEFHVDALRQDVEDDLILLEELRALAEGVVVSASDLKAERLIERLREIAEAAETPTKDGTLSGDRRKVIVFSTFADTIDHLHTTTVTMIEAAANDDLLSAFAGRVAPAVFGRKTGVSQEGRARTLARFAPETAGTGTSTDDYDLLFTTDVLSEGVNLQQAGRIINYDLPWNPMRVVQRHGRIDRIGSKHARVYLDCFFPATNLDRLLHLEERLQMKLAKADAAIGAGPVLPGVETGDGRVFADTREEIMKIWQGDTDILEDEGHHAALSGEEYRKRLRKSKDQTDHYAEIKRLPYGSGSGFVNPRIQQSGYVFCVRIGDHDRRWFRFVPTDDEWNPLTREDGSAVVIEDTLTSLAAADPENESTSRELPPAVYDKAFDAWTAAKAHVWESWKNISDGRTLLPDVPKALRDAAELVYEHGQHLGTKSQQDLLARLNTIPPARTQRAVRQLMNTDQQPSTKVLALQKLIEEEGVQRAEAPPSLPDVDPDEIRLVTWMAVSAVEKESGP